MACSSSSQRASSTLQGHPAWATAPRTAPCPPPTPPDPALPAQVLLDQHRVQQGQLLVQVLHEWGHSLQAAPSAPARPRAPHRPPAGSALTSSFWMESGDRLMCCTYFRMSATICGRAVLGTPQQGTQQPAPPPACQPAHLGSQVRGHGLDLLLQVFVQGLHAAEQGPRKPPFQRQGRLRPRQTPQSLPSSLAEKLHVVEHHAELGRRARCG